MTSTLTPARVLRVAVLADVPALVALGVRFLADSPYGAMIATNPDQIAALMTGLITEADGVVFVTATDGALDGMIGLAVHPDLLSGEKISSEFFWWSHGRSGLRLLRAGEQWALDHGAVRIHMIAPTDQVAKIYAARGYDRAETIWQRRLPQQEQM